MVKRGLRDAGFTWRKTPGFGRKRERRAANAAPPDDSDAPPRPGSRRRAPAPPGGGVIGAGLAGTSVAAALARRGVAVTLLERDAPGAGASGNRQGALYVKLAAETNPQSRVYLAGLLYTRRWLTALDPEQRLWQDCGVLQLAPGAKEATRQQRFLAHHALPERVVHGVDAATASQAAGTPLDAPGLDYPQAGWVRPDRLCRQLAASPGITQRRGEAHDLDFDADADAWRIALTDGSTLTADHVVVATAHETPRFTPLAGLPLKPIRGQLTHVPVPADAPSLARVVCAGGYVAPAMEGVISLGATFAPGDTDTAVRTTDHARNLDEFTATLPAFAEALRAAGVTLDPAACEGRAACAPPAPTSRPTPGQCPFARPGSTTTPCSGPMPAVYRHHRPPSPRPVGQCRAWLAGAGQRAAVRRGHRLPPVRRAPAAGTRAGRPSPSRSTSHRRYHSRKRDSRKRYTIDVIAER